MSTRQPPETSPESSAAHQSSTERTADVVLIHGVEPDGKGLRVLRYRDDKVETGAVRPLEEGKPIRGEVVRLKPRRDLPVVCDVEVELPATSQKSAPVRRAGPAQVATDRYRENWDRIWKSSRELPN